MTHHLLVEEVDALLAETGQGDPGVRVRTLVGAFMHPFYNGVESIPKRLCFYYNVPLPEGGRFHIDLLGLFGPDSARQLPLVLDTALYNDLEPFRQFRHVFRTSYGFQLDWTRFAPGAATARLVLDRFEAAVRESPPFA